MRPAQRLCTHRAWIEKLQAKESCPAMNWPAHLSRKRQGPGSSPCQTDSFLRRIAISRCRLCGGAGGFSTFRHSSRRSARQAETDRPTLRRLSLLPPEPRREKRTVLTQRLRRRGISRQIGQLRQRFAQSFFG